MIKRDFTKVVMLGHEAGIDNSYLLRVFEGSNFIFRKENKLAEIFSAAFQELNFITTHFNDICVNLINDGSSIVDHYAPEMQNISIENNRVITLELHVYQISILFKSFLMISKSCLDKFVPIYSYRHKSNLKQYSDNGDRLIKDIKMKISEEKVKKSIIKLIENNNLDWINSLIKIRDEYTHYSNLEKFLNFSVSNEFSVINITNSLSDFDLPSIYVDGKKQNAYLYMSNIREKMTLFFGEFLRLLDFNSLRRPRVYLQCEGMCGHHFARFVKDRSGEKVLKNPEHPIKIEVVDQQNDYGELICPDCGVKTETDIRYWQKITKLTKEPFSPLSRNF